METLTPKPTKYISWPVIALLDFVTIIGFDDILYPLQNQGLSVVFTWIFMVIAFVIPYEMSVTQLGSTFTDKQEGGLASWVRHSTNDTFGYWTAWMYWAACIPYKVDVANSAIVSLSWLILGNNTLSDHMSSMTFGVVTFVIILIFILLENVFKRSLEVMATLGGGAMFLMAVLFVAMTAWSLAHGGKIATHPFDLKAFIPSLSPQYFSTIGLLMFAVCGAEIVTPYLKKMKNPNRDFRKAMWLLAGMTAFLTVFGTFSLAIFFNANDLPADLKMNGSYYAFQLLGQRMGMGNVLMYVFAVVQTLYMMAQLAVFLDTTSWVLAGDTAQRFMPSFMTKRNKHGRPIHSYVLTSGLCLVLLLLSGTLPNINTVFNWLLNLNGIVFPFKNCWIFLAFIAIRKNHTKFKSDFVFIKSKPGALAVGYWCFFFSLACALMSFLPQDVAVGSSAWDKQLWLNLLSVGILFGTGSIFPLLAKLERKRQGLLEED